MSESRMRMWRSLLVVVACWIALEVLTHATAATWRRYSPDDYALRVTVCRNTRPDVVCVGSSVIAESIIPSELQSSTWPRVYNLGLSGGTVSEFYHALLRIDHTPRLLVYGITASDLNDARHEPHGPASLMTFHDVRRWAAERPDSRAWVIRRYFQSRCGDCSAIVRYRHGIRMWATEQAERLGLEPDAECERTARELRDTADTLATGDGYAPAAGFVHRDYEHSRANNIPFPPFAFLDRYRTGSHLKYLHKLIDWCETREVPLLLVDMPTTDELQATHAAAFAEYRRVLTDVVRTRNVMVLSAPREVVGLSHTEFADTIHLNARGATRFSRWLRGKLELLNQPMIEARAQLERHSERQP
jgi:hypothetical protein